MKPRKQCAKCPWKTSTDPFDIPNGYCPLKHGDLKSTIAEPGSLAGLTSNERLMMACHETGGNTLQLPCVGWLAHQLGEGNNIAIRMAVIHKQVDGNIETVGPQHKTLEDTLP